MGCTDSRNPFTADFVIAYADFEGSAIGSAEKGNRVEPEGKAEVDGKDDDKLKITRKDGMIENRFVDAAAGKELWRYKIGSVFKSRCADGHFIVLSDRRKV